MAFGTLVLFALSCTPPPPPAPDIPERAERGIEQVPVREPVRAPAKSDRSYRPSALVETKDVSSREDLAQLPLPDRQSVTFPLAREIHREPPVPESVPTAPRVKPADSNTLRHSEPRLPVPERGAREPGLRFPEPVASAPSSVAQATPSYQRGRLGQDPSHTLDDRARMSRTFTLEVLFVVLVFAALGGAAWYRFRYESGTRRGFRNDFDGR